MRSNCTRFFAASIVGSVSLLLAACGGGDKAADSDNASDVEETGLENIEGSTDDMTAIDSAAGAEAEMTMDNIAEDSNAASEDSSSEKVQPDKESAE